MAMEDRRAASDERFEHMLRRLDKAFEAQTFMIVVAIFGNSLSCALILLAFLY